MPKSGVPTFLFSILFEVTNALGRMWIEQQLLEILRPLPIFVDDIVHTFFQLRNQSLQSFERENIGVSLQSITKVVHSRLLPKLWKSHTITLTFLTNETTHQIDKSGIVFISKEKGNRIPYAITFSY